MPLKTYVLPSGKKAYVDLTEFSPEEREEFLAVATPAEDEQSGEDRKATWVDRGLSALAGGAGGLVGGGLPGMAIGAVMGAGLPDKTTGGKVATFFQNAVPGGAISKGARGLANLLKIGKNSRLTDVAAKGLAGMTSSAVRQPVEKVTSRVLSGEDVQAGDFKLDPQAMLLGAGLGSGLGVFTGSAAAKNSPAGQIIRAADDMAGSPAARPGLPPPQINPDAAGMFPKVIAGLEKRKSEISEQLEKAETSYRQAVARYKSGNAAERAAISKELKSAGDHLKELETKRAALMNNIPEEQAGLAARQQGFQKEVVDFVQERVSLEKELIDLKGASKIARDNLGAIGNNPAPEAQTMKKALFDQMENAAERTDEIKKRLAEIRGGQQIAGVTKATENVVEAQSDKVVDRINQVALGENRAAINSARQALAAVKEKANNEKLVMRDALSVLGADSRAQVAQLRADLGGIGRKIREEYLANPAAKEIFSSNDPTDILNKLYSATPQQLREAMRYAGQEAQQNIRESLVGEFFRRSTDKSGRLSNMLGEWVGEGNNPGFASRLSEIIGREETDRLRGLVEKIAKREAPEDSVTKLVKKFTNSATFMMFVYSPTSGVLATKAALGAAAYAAVKWGKILNDSVKDPKLYDDLIRYLDAPLDATLAQTAKMMSNRTAPAAVQGLFGEAMTKQFPHLVKYLRKNTVLLNEEDAEALRAEDNGMETGPLPPSGNEVGRGTPESGPQGQPPQMPPQQPQMPPQMPQGGPGGPGPQGMPPGMPPGGQRPPG
jgi:hypothetical protein